MNKEGNAMNSFMLPSAVLATQSAADNTTGATIFVVDTEDEFRTAVFRDFAAHGLRANCFDRAEPFLNALRNCRPGCVILDMHLPDRNSLQLQELLTSQFYCTPLILVARDADPATVVRAMRMGAHDFMLKPVDLETLRARTEGALQAMRRLGERELLQETMRRRLRTLTAREYHILMLALTGRSNKEVSSMLFISPRTVETHRSRILEKIGVSNLLELAYAFTDTQDWRSRPDAEEEHKAARAVAHEAD
ncbi:MAG TPA: LuxR C-terminal-related transcriptional regulator [Gallionellaceae bacterium]|nr:LuxR C-terminal-related transcriptional regulator [Gallionellaceae bacterium]